MIFLLIQKGGPSGGTPLLNQVRVQSVKEFPENTVLKIEMDEILCYKEITAFFCLFNKI